jgi:hypothetical protein
MFQNFSAKALAFEPSPAPAQRAPDEARELIGRYPNLSEIELARLINLYRELSALDRFSADHRSKVRTPFRHYAALVAYAVVGVAAVAWAISLSW